MFSDRKVKKTSVLFVKNPYDHQKLRFFHGLHGRLATLGFGSNVFFIAFRHLGIKAQF
jgi:hypothetical protein